MGKMSFCELVKIIKGFQNRTKALISSLSLTITIFVFLIYLSRTEKEDWYGKYMFGGGIRVFFCG